MGALGPGTKGDDLQTLEADHCPGDGHEFHHLLGNLLGVSHRVLGDITLQATQAQVIGTVEHAAVGVSPAVDQVSVPFGGGHKHAGTVKILGDQGLRGLRTKVAQEYGQGVAARSLHFFHCLEHVLLIFHGGLGFVDLQALSGTGCHHGGPAILGKPNGEAVTGDCHNAQFHLRDIVHHVIFLQSKTANLYANGSVFIVA